MYENGISKEEEEEEDNRVLSQEMVSTPRS
jgi:hypothetical protein